MADFVETSGLTKKYLWHSNDTDFFYFSDREMEHAEDFSDTELDELATLIRENVETSRSIERILDDEEKPKSMHRNLQFD